MTQTSHTNAALRSLMKELEAALNDFGQACYAFLPAPRHQNDLVMRIHYSLTGFSKHLVNSPLLFEVASQSNHRAMEAQAFENARCEDMDRIVDLIQKLRPDLSSRETKYALDLHGRRPEAKPRFVLEIDGEPLREKLASAKTIVAFLRDYDPKQKAP
tara:strand:+ start:786 stop:1259 length:474 start_codon:yes stop_codon:yes gene_type:complete